MTSSTATCLPRVCFLIFSNNHCVCAAVAVARTHDNGIKITFVARYQEVKALNDCDVYRGSATSRKEERLKCSISSATQDERLHSDVGGHLEGFMCLMLILS